MSDILLKIINDSSVKTDSQDSGLELELTNPGPSGEFTFQIRIDDLGYVSKHTVHLNTMETVRMGYELEIGDLDSPSLCRVEVGSNSGDIPTRVSKLLTVLPRGFHDRLSGTFVRDICSDIRMLPETPSKNSIEEDMEEVYGELMNLEILPLTTERFMEVRDPDDTLDRGSGTCLDIAAYAASLIRSKGRRYCMVFRNHECYVGIGTSDSPGSLRNFEFIDPVSACKEVPLVVSKDAAKTSVQRMMSSLKKDRDYYLESVDDD